MVRLHNSFIDFKYFIYHRRTGIIIIIVVIKLSSTPTFGGIILWVAFIIIYMGVHEAFMPKTRQNEHISPLKNIALTENYDFVSGRGKFISVF